MASTPLHPDPSLYPGEHIGEFSGVQTLYGYFAAPDRSGRTDSRPLVVFVPGSAHYARIAYGGHDGHRAHDFLAHWLNSLGYDVLGVSYPLESNTEKHENQLLPPSWHNLTVDAWGRLVAETARHAIDEHGRQNGDIIVLAWSMAGRVLKSLSRAAPAFQLHIQLFVSLAATPGGISGLRPPGGRVVRTAAGYARGRFEEDFAAQVVATGSIPRETYLREYFGHTPASLGIWGLFPVSGEVDDDTINDTPGFVTHEGRSLAEAGLTRDDYARCPWIGAVRPTQTSDVRHVLADHATWGMVLTYKLTADVTAALGTMRGRGPSEEAEDAWRDLQSLVASAPARLTNESVDGGHFFFLGDKGAQATAHAVERLWTRAQELQREMADLLSRMQGKDERATV